MRYAKLCKQGGRHIALIHNLVYTHSTLAQCTSTPDHRDMEIVGLLIAAMEHATMVGNEYHKQIVPHMRNGLQTVNQTTNSGIGVGKDIKSVILQGS